MTTHYRGNPRTALALSTFIKLSRAAESLYALLSERLRETGLTHGQIAVLEALLHLGPLNQRELGAKLLRTGPNMTTVIDNLEKRALARRISSDRDRRVSTVMLTKKGDSLIRRIFPIHAGHIERFLSVLSGPEQTELGRLCKKLGLGMRATLFRSMAGAKPDRPSHGGRPLLLYVAHQKY